MYARVLIYPGYDNPSISCSSHDTSNRLCYIIDQHCYFIAQHIYVESRVTSLDNLCYAYIV